jgi:hypothetical protein
MGQDCRRRRWNRLSSANLHLSGAETVAGAGCRWLRFFTNSAADEFRLPLANQGVIGYLKNRYHITSPTTAGTNIALVRFVDRLIGLSMLKIADKMGVVRAGLPAT